MPHVFTLEGVNLSGSTPWYSRFPIAVAGGAVLVGIAACWLIDIIRKR